MGDLLLWKIWFYRKGKVITRTNLETTTLEDGTLDLPDAGVLLIQNIRRDQNGTRWGIEFGRNAYCRVGDEWWGTTEFGLLNYFADYLGTAAILRGMAVDNKTWQQVYNQACNDPQILQVTQDFFVRDPLRE